MQEKEKRNMEKSVIYDEVQDTGTLRNPGAVNLTLNSAYNALAKH